jgi:hypothetical protein
MKKPLSRLTKRPSDTELEHGGESGRSWQRSAGCSRTDRRRPIALRLTLGRDAESMDGLQFIASLVESLAWPLAVTFLALVLRAPLAGALSGPVKRWKAGPSGLEVEYWEEAIEAARAELEHSPEVGPVLASLPGSDDELTRLAEASPRAAVMEAFARVEAELRSVLEGDARAERAGGIRLARLAHDRGRISDETLKAVERMAVLRNLAAHGHAHEIDVTQAIDFVGLADAVLLALRTGPANN